MEHLATPLPRYRYDGNTPPSFTETHIVKWGRLVMFVLTDDALSLRL